jgi:multidrug efflux pump subunit AcrA (membrane-fusion protein)
MITRTSANFWLNLETRKLRVTIVLGIVAIGPMSFIGCKGETDGEMASRKTAIVARRDIRAQIQATGVVRAMIGAEVKVGSRVSGKVERLFANIGDQVKKGDQIAKLEDADLKARVARAEAELASARAQLALLRRGARTEEISEAEGTLQQAEAELALATIDAERQTKLFAQEMVANEDADKAQRNLAVAKGKIAAAQSRVELLKHRYLPEEIALAEAKVKLAEAGVMEARVNLSYATLVAPIDGVVAQVTTQEGETVAAGMNSPTFVTIIDLGKLEVAAFVDEVDIGRVTIGQGATFTVDSFPDVDFTGKVTAVYPRAVIQSNVVNYITTLSVDNSEGRLKPDMTATVNIVLEERKDVLALPEKALRREGGKRVVRVVNGKGSVSRTVRVGRRGGGFIEILDGLKEGEVVLVNGSTSEQGKGKSS